MRLQPTARFWDPEPAAASRKCDRKSIDAAGDCLLPAAWWHTYSRSPPYVTAGPQGQAEAHCAATAAGCPLQQLFGMAAILRTPLGRWLVATVQQQSGAWPTLAALSAVVAVYLWMVRT
jgi:hypothetical protein